MDIGDIYPIRRHV